MKKNYLFTLFLAICSVFSALGQVTNGDFETWTNDAPDGWTSEAGTTITKETTKFRSGTSSAKFEITTQTQADTDFRQSLNVELGKIYEVSVWVYQEDKKARARLYFDGYQGYSNPETLNSWQQVTYEYTATDTKSIDIGLRFYDISADWEGGPSIMYIDDYTVTEKVTTEPSLLVTSPTDGTNYTPNTTSVAVTMNVQNFNFSMDNGSGASDNSGDGFLKATLEVLGGSTTVSNFFSTSVPDIQVSAGESYTLILELVDNAGASLTPELKYVSSFSVGSFSDVSNIAGLRAGTVNSYYRLTGEATVTYTSSNRNQKYIQDTSGAILIDDSADVLAPGNFMVGDGITNLNGKLSIFNGVLQIVPVSNSGSKSSSGNTVVPVSVTLSELNANLDNYESEMITISAVSFAAGDGTAVFEASKNYDLSKETDMLVFRTNFSDADFIGDVIPSAPVDITGIASEFNGTAQIFGISKANITLDVQSNSILGFATYPNPITNNEFTITSNNSSKKEIVLFNVLGKKVLSTSFTGTKSTVDVSTINSGIYILKVTENGKTATKKVVIR
ncbi:T9SS type A sorting domain-containing protein [Polaribacter aestuariivivens]|uniref:T9SS type A sorting domain-containing protein n=1 Tax=Polaribacter aestuariivivens TaxID=2304626 RepID=A0A5S3N5Z8_9FLAO|nr:T9SS type A sorting domain-containing protein [Polaribacter aestuariivivens]TMM29914.1 T9SS type A sorting domain-containing protein [Polaribacter aestuariivivens]